jgi:D-aminopeptidase
MTVSRARARDLGLAPGKLPAGAVNAITDVPGIRVGHTTLIEGSDIRTGVTAIVHDALIGADPEARRTLPAGLSVFNGFGKMVGTSQVSELGTIETPVLLTGTLSVFRVADALLSCLHSRPGFSDSGTLNPIVAETNDGYLSDIWARPITEQHVRAALDGAAGGPVEEGCAGAGTGTGALGYKAGIGTSSRVCQQSTGPVTLGALVQANFGGKLTVLGVPCPPAPDHDQAPAQAHDQAQAAGNSCVIVLATDARLDSRQLTRLAARAFGGMARAGSDFSGRSGDYALALSTAAATTTGPATTGPATTGPATGGQAAGSQPTAANGGGPVPDKDLDVIFLAAIEATQEALLNSIFMAVTTTGAGGRTRRAVPLDYVLARVSGRSARRYES